VDCGDGYPPLLEKPKKKKKPENGKPKKNFGKELCAAAGRNSDAKRRTAQPHQRRHKEYCPAAGRNSDAKRNLPCSLSDLGKVG
jgi:hypothetical protein